MTTTDGEARTAGRLQISDLVKVYDPKSGQRAVDEVSLDIEPGEFVTLLGPSGCGKTTILRTIAGFEQPTSGGLSLDGRDLAKLPPNRRPVSMVFQSYALFPHMTVRENVGYGLKAGGVRRTELQERVDEALETMSLTPYADRAPSALSGGQQQRVALARAMVMQPQVMLFDEPLSNLDAALREQMRFEIRRLQRRLGTTAVYVTHDQSEAMAMSDRVVVLSSGKVEQVGPPAEIYRRPASRFVAGFVGRANFLPAELRRTGGEGRAEVLVGGLGGASSSYEVPAHSEAREGDDVVLLVRPESLRVSPDPGSGARVSATVFMGDRVEYEVEMPEGEGPRRLQAAVMDPAEEDILPEGTPVRVGIVPERAWLLPA